MTEKPGDIKIAVVDDEAPITDVISKLLEKFEYRVETFNRSEMALKSILERPVDILISDIRMPGLDGLALMDKVLEAHPETRAIIMTGHGDVDTAVQAMRHGACDFLQKPLSLKKLRESLDQASFLIRHERSKEDATQPAPGGDAMSTDTEKLMKPNQIGGYKVLRKIGEGAVGVVFQCEKPGDSNLYALKLLKVDNIDSEDRETFVRRFVNEGNAISQLDHPNVIKFYEYGQRDDGRRKIPYIVMEYFPSRPLTYYLNHPDKLDLRAKVSILRQVANALRAVHERHISHRDIKPDNLLVDEDLNLKITDFGVCHLPMSNLTITHNLVGTPSYLSPENLRYGHVDSLMDVYSLGVVSYELFFGIRPYEADNFHELMRKIINEYPIEPRVLNPEFPSELQNILAKMLKKNPKQRYQDAAAIIVDLDAFEAAGKKSGIFDRLKKLSLFSKDWR